MCQIAINSLNNTFLKSDSILIQTYVARLMDGKMILDNTQSGTLTPYFVKPEIESFDRSQKLVDFM